LSYEEAKKTMLQFSAISYSKGLNSNASNKE
jgi:hypothetical protein